MQDHLLVLREKTMIYIHYYDSPLGRMIASSDGYKLTGLWFEGQQHCIDTSNLKDLTSENKLTIFSITDRWLDTYFGGIEPDYTPPLCFTTTSFRCEVFKTLLTIPYGQTVTYSKLAEKIAKKRGLARMAAQAVGSALSHNPVLVIIPCHRVIGSKGSLTGYAAGTDKKLALLTMEKSL